MTSVLVLFLNERWSLLYEPLACFMRVLTRYDLHAYLFLKERWSLFCEALVCFARVFTCYYLHACPFLLREVEFAL